MADGVAKVRAAGARQKSGSILFCRVPSESSCAEKREQRGVVMRVRDFFAREVRR
jgi:hypothetical protein